MLRFSLRQACLTAIVATTFGISRVADAYPTAVVVAPTAEAKPLGGVNAAMLGSSVVSPTPAFRAVAPSVGAQVGVMPSISLAKGVAIGGLELGVDALGPGDGTMKAVLNGKLQLLKQVGWVPSVGVGFMQFAPSAPNRSLNDAYVTLTEAVVVGRHTSLGSFTLGYARAFVPRTPKGEEPMFRGTAPFPSSSKSGLLFGYQSPSFSIFTVAVDHVGGTSEVSATSAALFASPLEWLVAGAGVMFSNDRSDAVRADGIFGTIGMELELLGGASDAKKEQARTKEKRRMAKSHYPAPTTE